MRFGALTRHWNRLGKRDAQWAVLTHPDKRHARWTLDAFLESGTKEIDAVLARLGPLGLPLTTTRALDFGCGAGRLTQALAARFDRADGVDIASSMLDEARKHASASGRAAYHLNAASDLSLFPEHAFTFVYSTLVLQHMEPRFSRVYIAEFLRVLAPGGVAVFQVPSRRVTTLGDARTTQTAVQGRLPGHAHRARIDTDVDGRTMQANDEIAIRATVTNTSGVTWPSLSDAGGNYRINLANQWRFANGALHRRDDARAALPHDLGPGESVEVLLYVHAPQHDGDYRLRFDVVQEDGDWFASQGSMPVDVPVRVTGGLPALAAPAADAAERAGDAPPFRERHPVAFALMRATGLRAVYWSWRHALDFVKHRRDRAINWWAGVSFEPRMEMHWVPRADVEAIVSSSGGRVVAVDTEMTTGGYESCRYWVAKG